jgi:hypothetical protein
LAQYSERFREAYRGYKETGTKEASVDVKEDVKAIDFFHGLDQGRYGAFKTSMLNGWAAKAFDPPKTINDIYQVAATWVKPSTRIERGTAASLITIEEDEKQKASQKKIEKEKAKKTAAAAEGGQEQGGQQKQLKGLSHIQCFKCKEFGHYSMSPDCPKNQEKANVNVTKEDTRIRRNGGAHGRKGSTRNEGTKVY